MLVTMMYLPTIMHGIANARQTQTDVTTAQQQQQWASAVGNYVSQNMTALEASATATAPVTLSVATLQAANAGLPTNFSGTNPFSQTWTAQVLQPTAGTLQVLAFSSGGNVIKDQELGQIARAAGGSGGFIPTNNSGAYSGGPATAYGTFGSWKIATAGYSVGSGGAPASLLVFTNGALSSNYLYRNAVPGQPQLNEMNTALNMGGNAITNANGVITAGGSNAQSLQVGSAVYYGDPNNAAVRTNGTLFIQNVLGTAAAPLVAGATTVEGNAAVTGNTTVNGTVVAGGDVDVSGNTFTAGNATVAQNFSAGGQITAGGFVQVNGFAVQGAGCAPNGLIGNSGAGPLFCQSGVWTAVNGGGAYVNAFGFVGDSGFIPNGSGKTQWVMASGGDGGNNSCQLSGNVSGVGGVANHSDNNTSLAKACFISFPVPPGASWQVTSAPWDAPPGSFTAFVYQ
jgi:hypothetical protein